MVQSREVLGAHDGFLTAATPKPPYLQERARRREESRRRVEQVALELFTEHGFAAVTVEMVCAEAGIAVATFYRYFGSKEDVFFGYEPLFLEALDRCVGQVDTSRPPASQVLQFVEAFGEFLEGQRESLAQRDRLVRDVPALRARTFAIQREWETVLARALASRRGRDEPDDDDQMDAALCLEVLRGALRRWRSDPTLPLAQRAAQVLTRLRDRLAPATGH